MFALLTLHRLRHRLWFKLRLWCKLCLRHKHWLRLALVDYLMFWELDLELNFFLLLLHGLHRLLHGLHGLHRLLLLVHRHQLLLLSDLIDYSLL